MCITQFYYCRQGACGPVAPYIQQFSVPYSWMTNVKVHNFNLKHFLMHFVTMYKLWQILLIIIFASPLPQMKASTSTNMHQALKFLSDIYKHPFPNIHMTPVTNKEVKDTVKSLKWKYAYGYDEIPQHILKIRLPFILAPLTYIYV
jgi:hypothetical protein